VTLRDEPFPDSATYADILRLRLKTSRDAFGRPLTIREVSNQLGVTYEHLRTVLLGKMSLSKELNDRLCLLLKLDPEAMWEKLLTQRFTQKLGRPLGSPSADAEIARLWHQLTDEQRAELRKLMEAMANINRMTNVRVG
jgi:hypothetical protein